MFVSLKIIFPSAIAAVVDYSTTLTSVPTRGSVTEATVRSLSCLKSSSSFVRIKKLDSALLTDRAINYSGYLGINRHHRLVSSSSEQTR